MENIEEKNKIIALLLTGEDSHINLAQQLCKGQVLDFNELLEDVFILSFWEKAFPKIIGKYKQKKTQVKHLLTNDKVVKTFTFDDTATKEENYFSNLVALDLRWEENMIEVDESISKLVSLRKLILQSTNIKSLPSSIENLTNLEELNIGHTDVNSLPENISNFSQLKVLDLTCCRKISKIPEGIGALKNLTFLSLSNVHSKLPESIGELNNLEELDTYFTHN